MTFKVLLLPSAEYDLRYIYEYFSFEHSNHELAKSFYQKLKNAIQSLNQMPARFQIYDKEPWASRGMRKMPVGKFIVFYIVNEGNASVHIIRILYAGRNMDDCLKETLFP